MHAFVETRRPASDHRRAGAKWKTSVDNRRPGRYAPSVAFQIESAFSPHKDFRVQFSKHMVEEGMSSALVAVDRRIHHNE